MQGTWKTVSTGKYLSHETIVANLRKRVALPDSGGYGQMTIGHACDDVALLIEDKELWYVNSIEPLYYEEFIKAVDTIFECDRIAFQLRHFKEICWYEQCKSFSCWW